MAATMNTVDVSNNAGDSNPESLSSLPLASSSFPSSSSSSSSISISSSTSCSPSSSSSSPPSSSSPSTPLSSSSSASSSLSLSSSSLASSSLSLSSAGLVSMVCQSRVQQSGEERERLPLVPRFKGGGSSQFTSSVWCGTFSEPSQNGAGEAGPSRVHPLMPVPKAGVEKGKGKEEEEEEKEEEEEEESEQKRARIYEEGDVSQWYQAPHSLPREIWPRWPGPPMSSRRRSPMT